MKDLGSHLSHGHSRRASDKSEKGESSFAQIAYFLHTVPSQFRSRKLIFDNTVSFEKIETSKQSTQS